MKEHAIGEVFEWFGKRYYAVLATRKNCCSYCAFHNPRTNHEALACAQARCEARHRTDGNDVRFKEVE